MKDIKTILEEVDLENVVGGLARPQEIVMSDQSIAALADAFAAEGYPREKVVTCLTELASQKLPLTSAKLADELALRLA